MVRVRMSAFQEAVYNRMKSASLLKMQSGREKALRNAMMQMRKICNHPYTFPEFEPQTDTITDRIGGWFPVYVCRVCRVFFDGWVGGGRNG